MNYTIEKRSGVDVLVFETGGCRPATNVEVEMWAELAAKDAELQKWSDSRDGVMSHIESIECKALWFAEQHRIDTEQIAALTAERDRYRELHQELIMEVCHKCPNESRHETARRIIRERETPHDNGIAQAAKEGRK